MSNQHTASAPHLSAQADCIYRARGEALNTVESGWNVAAIAAAWNCQCRGDCSGVDAAQCLYRSTLEWVSGHEAVSDSQGELLRPLAAVVNRQTTRAGQDECRRYAHALREGDGETALSACHRLIAIERECIAASAAPVRMGGRAGKSA